MNDYIPSPPDGYETATRYRLNARQKRAFHTVLDAANILDPSGAESVVTFRSAGDGFTIELEHPLNTGRITEALRCSIRAGHVHGDHFRRHLHDSAGKTVRTEEADFGSDILGLPSNLFPEVALPFMLGWLPQQRGARSFHAWINDRFVARVYVEQKKPGTVTVPAGTISTFEVIMYPDLNDWVSVGATVAKLMKPLVPKYHMHYEVAAPYRLVRFEGPYGPPGAPEVVLEMV